MDKYYMEMALELAKKGIGKVNPNPLVGAVIVKNGEVIGQGYHQMFGEAHAEVNAFNSATEDTNGATMYVTLEPCSHYGKTPPCVEKIIKNRIARVVIGMIDPNSLVAGKGIKRLQDVGIDVTVGVLEKECKNLNKVFIKYITSKRPFVVLKAAVSLDGKIATSSGESKWISGEDSRKAVHRLRNQLTGIMVGIDTVIKDDPQLTCRIEEGRNPVRIIVDSKLRIPEDSKIINTSKEIKTIIATTEKVDKEKCRYLQEKDIFIIKTRAKDDRVDLEELMVKLGELNIDSILLEGGSTLNYSALEAKIVDKVLIYISPKIIGGVDSKTAVGGKGISNLKDAFKVRDVSTSIVGEDILLEGYIQGDEE